MKYNILITGVSGGLGQAIKSTFTKNKVNIYGHSHTSQSDLQLDFNNFEDYYKVENFIKEKNINCIINNAGVYSNNLLTTSNENILEIINVNLVAPIIITKYLLNYLGTEKEGLILNINSIAGKYPNYNESVYCATKFGLRGFSTSLAMGSKNNKVKIVDCYPGALKTKMCENRPNFSTFIDPADLAQEIYNIFTKFKTGFITSFEYRKI